MVLEADPAGLGFLPMGCLDHQGYKMSNPEDFYQHMILEVVSNKANHSTYYEKNLSPVANMTPRLRTRTFNPTARNAINQHMRMNVMYSKAKNARGKVSRVSELHVNDAGDTFWEAWSNAEEGQVRPKLIAVPLPKPDEARYVWIDMSWPIRAILLPVAQNPYDGMHPHCVYVQLNFRRLKGKIASSGYHEDGNQGFSWWEGDKKNGMYWTWSAASMRVDIDMMYGTLLVPRERREIGDDLACLQMHRWSNVPYDWHSSDKNLNYWVDWRPRCINDHGLPLDRFLSNVNEVGLQYMPRTPSKIAAILDTLVQFGLGFVPIVGPLLAFLGSEIINAIEDPTRYSTKEKMQEKFGDGSAKPLMESIVNFGKFVKKKSFMSSIPIRSGLTIGASIPTFGASIPTKGVWISTIGESIPTAESQLWSIPGLDLQQSDEKLDPFVDTKFSGLMPMFADELEEFQLHPEVFTCEPPADLPVLKKNPEDQKAEETDMPEQDEAEGSHNVAAPAEA